MHKRVHTPFVAETVSPAEPLRRLGPASMALGHQQPHCTRSGGAGGTADTPGRSPPPDLSAVFRTQQEGGRRGAGTGPSHQGGPGWPGETDPTDEQGQCPGLGLLSEHVLGPPGTAAPRLFRGCQRQVTAVGQPCEESGHHRSSGFEQSSDPVAGEGWHSPYSFSPLRPLLRYSS